MIQYPFLEQHSKIGITASSSGVPNELHHLLHDAVSKMKSKGFNIVEGKTIWTQDKAASAPVKIRVNEFNEMMEDNDIQLIFPPWGGNLLIEMLEYIDFESIQKKWILGYSDTSLLLLAITLKTGIATAHGTNLVDVRGEYSDETTAMWEKILSTKQNESITQYSSKKYQKEWQFENPTPVIFHLTEDTTWKVVSDHKANIKGRLLGGCVDVIRHLVGTPFGKVQYFNEKYINDEPIIWFFENCDLTVVDLRRSILQMKLAGWFENCSGIMFGRSAANHAVDNYTVDDFYQQLYKELGIPIIYDIDCGHVPPQLTFINGAYAQVQVEEGKGTVKQSFI